MKRMLVLAAVLCGALYAGGENVLRTDALIWDELGSPHFRIVFPVGMTDRARETAFDLEEGYARTAAALDVRPVGTVTVILYASPNQFEQTNIMGAAVPESLAAFTETFRDRIVLPAVSSRREAKYLLQHELVHAFEFGALMPRRLPSFYIIRAPFYPDWLYEGLAEYLADTDATYSGMIIRDLALDDRLVPLERLFGFSHLDRHEVVPAYKQSGAFFRYLAFHDARNPARLLKAFADRMPWRMDTVIKTALGRDAAALDREFRDYLAGIAGEETAGREEPRPAYAVAPDLGARHFRTFCTDAVPSPDGKCVAFLADPDDLTQIYIMRVDGSQRRAVANLKFNFSIESVHRGAGATLAWSPDSAELFFVGEWANRDHLYRFRTADGALERIELDFSEIGDITLSPDGGRVLFRGVRNGVADLYIYTLGTGKMLQLTRDPYDDNAPAWNRNGWAVVYSSERNGQRDLFTIDAQADDPALTAVQVTATPADELTPAWNPAGDKIAFVSDMTGFYELFVMDAYSRAVYKQTNLRGGAFQPRFMADGNTLLYSYFRHGQYQLHTVPLDCTPGRQVALETTEAVRAETFGYREGAAGDQAATGFKDTFTWNALLPLGVFNWVQMGDLLAADQIDANLYPTFTRDGMLLNGDVTWWHRPGRLDYGVGIALTSVTDTAESERDDDLRLIGEVRYPLDAFRSLTGGVIAGDRRTCDGGTLLDDRRRLGVTAAVAHDNRLYRGPAPVRGLLLEAGGEAFPGSGDLERYGLVHAAYEQAFALREDHILWVRVRSLIAAGRDRIDLDLADFVRGYGRDDILGSGAAAGTVEYRFPVWRGINLGLAGHYLLLKDCRGFLFMDTAVVADAPYREFLQHALGMEYDLRRSIGGGVQFDLYGLQKAPAAVRAGYARINDGIGAGSSLFLELAFTF
ncbi:MAG: hypothetical protein ABIF71_00655 [Planctomycetota bacterium]